MFRRKVVFGVVACLLALLIVGQTLSQPAQRGQRGGQRENVQNAERPQRERPQFDPERMQKMMEQRTQRQVGASDEDWKKIGPSVMKVSQLNQQLSGGGMFGGRRGGPMAGRMGAQGEPTELDKATEQLEKLLENDSAKPEDIEKQLTAYRAAKDTAKKQLVAEQQKLQKQVNVRQKAQLVLMGLLD